MSFIERLQRGDHQFDGVIPFGPSRKIPKLHRENVSPASIKKTNSYDVSLNVRKIKHGLKEKLADLLVVFAKYDEMKSFTFDYRILSDNHPEEQAGILHVHIEL